MVLAEITKYVHCSNGQRSLGGTCDELGADLALEEQRSKSEGGNTLLHVSNCMVERKMYEGDGLVLRIPWSSRILPREHRHSKTLSSAR